MTLGSGAESFDQRVQHWQVFYATLGGVSATLVGLLFVALYMNVDRFIKAAHQYRKRPARMVFGSAVLALFCPLVFLIPGQNVWGPATLLRCAGGSALLDTVWTSAEVRSHRRSIPPANLQRIDRSMTRAFAGRAALVVTSLLLLTDVPGLFYWLAVPLIASLLAACINCWDLLVGARERLSHGWRRRVHRQSRRGLSAISYCRSDRPQLLNVPNRAENFPCPYSTGAAPCRLRPARCSPGTPGPALSSG